MIELRPLDVPHFLIEERRHLANGCTAKCGCIGFRLFCSLSLSMNLKGRPMLNEGMTQLI